MITSNSIPITAQWRWIPRVRFSLLTLTLGVLFLGSAGTLWWNWGPFEVAFVVDEPATIQDATISDDDRFLYITYGEREGKDRHVDVRRLPSGERHCLLDLPERGGMYVSGRNFVIYDNSTFPTATQLKVIDAQTLKSLGHDEILNDKNSPASCSIYPDYADRTHDHYKSLEIFKLPDVTPIATIDTIEWMPGQTNAIDKIGFYRHGRLEIFSLATATSIQTEPVGERIDAVVFTATTMTGYAARSLSLGPGYVFSLANGRLLQKTDSAGAPTAFTNDGTRCLTRKMDGLEIRDLFSGQIVATRKQAGGLSGDAGVFSPDGNLWLDPTAGRVHDAKTLAPLWEFAADFGRFSLNSEMVMLAGGRRIYAARNGALLMDFSSLRWREYAPVEKIEFVHHSPEFLLHPPKQQRIVYFRLRRPWAWYGALVMPELWVSGVLGGALLWSLRRGTGVGS